MLLLLLRQNVVDGYVDRGARVLVLDRVSLHRTPGLFVRCDRPERGVDDLGRQMQRLARGAFTGGRGGREGRLVEALFAKNTPCLLIQRLAYRNASSSMASCRVR